MLFCDQIGELPDVFVDHHLTSSLTVVYCPHYQLASTKLTWEQFDDVAAKEQICIVNYLDGVIPPGPNFDIKKLSVMELQLLVGPYIAAIQAEEDIAGTTFHVVKWPQGMSLQPCTTNYS